MSYQDEASPSAGQRGSQADAIVAAIELATRAGFSICIEPGKVSGYVVRYRATRLDFARWPATTRVRDGLVERPDVVDALAQVTALLRLELDLDSEERAKRLAALDREDAEALLSDTAPATSAARDSRAGAP